MDEQNDPVITVEHAWFAYTVGSPFVLKDVSCTIQKGEFIALVGQNGSGKTTLAKHLNGILRPQKGRVVVKGVDTCGASNSKLAPIVGYCYQNPDHQIFSDSVRTEMEFGPRNMGQKKMKLIPGWKNRGNWWVLKNSPMLTLPTWGKANAKSWQLPPCWQCSRKSW
jgi:energy-coupling factor transport system ATP-binding protein